MPSRIESFEITIQSLKRDRIVWVYLPDGYDEKGSPYPVIYMQDGQNIFYDKLTAYGKAWHADRIMDGIRQRTQRSAVIVGVESSVYRLSEYSPWKTAHPFAIKEGKRRRWAGGEGENYAEFFAKQLKPIIDAKYNTDRERNATAIIGSSMGGYISCYIALKYQRIYETMGLFSVFSKFNKFTFNRFINKTEQTLPQHALVYCGGREGDNGKQRGEMLRSAFSLYHKLAARGVSAELLCNSGFAHDENAWEVYFEKFASDFLCRYYSGKQS